MSERTCIVTRQVLGPEHMIRFVADPEGRVIADLKGNLPGRGAWVLAKKETVGEAVEKNAFARAFKRKVVSDPMLPETVEELLADRALAALGFARKAGECITGADKVAAALLKGKVLAVLHASDAAEDGKRKLAATIRSVERDNGDMIAVWNTFSSMQMNLALGGTNVIHAALTKGGAAQSCVKSIARLASYRSNDSISVSNIEAETMT